MNVTLPYAGEHMTADAGWLRCLGKLECRTAPVITNIEDALKHGLDNPIGIHGPLRQCCRPGDSVLIVVSDASRKTGIHLLLPHLLEWFDECGISSASVAFLVALGVHRATTSEERATILGPDIHSQFEGRIFNHNAYDASALVHVGATRRGTPVHLNRLLRAYDHLILTGTVTPHYFAGFGGGRKALVPGIAGATTIAHNHALNLHPTEDRLNSDVRIGRLDGNPVSEDLLEAARMYPPDFIINTVLDGEGNIVGLFTGEMDAAHRSACKLAEQICCLPIHEQANLVIAAVTAPNFVQSHKALYNAYRAMKPPAGRIILVSPAHEGLGSRGFERYLEMKTPQAVIAALRRQADINGQTALSTLEKAPHTIMVTNMSDAAVALTGARKAETLEDAMMNARDFFRQAGVSQPTCWLMPEAAATVPTMKRPCPKL